MPRSVAPTFPLGNVTRPTGPCAFGSLHRIARANFDDDHGTAARVVAAMCTWQSITYLLDGYIFVLFALTVVANFVMGAASLSAVAKIERRSGGTDWRKRWSRDDEGPTDQELRGTGYAWLLPIRRITAIAVVATITYGLLSPTLCPHFIKCAEPIGFFQPDRSCDNIPSAR